MERRDVLENCANNPDPPPLAASDMPDLEKLGADVINDITRRMTKRELVTSTTTPSLILGNIIELSAADLEQWKALLNDPLTVSPAIVQHLLRLRDSTSISPRKEQPRAIFHIRTFQLTVDQLRKLIPVLDETRITFFGRIFEWERRIATLPDHALVYLRHTGVSKSDNA